MLNTTKEPSSKKKQDEVLNHKLTISDAIDLPPSEFYDRIEKAIAAHKIPGLEISKVGYAEGGLLSDKRIYLRMIRERLAFDACAAPFGTDYFFSSRTVYSPVRVKLWQVLVVLFCLYWLFKGLSRPLGAEYAAIATVSFVVAVALTFKNVVALDISDLDALLLKIPVVSPIYEGWFRKETYYREDTRLVYLEIIPRIIQEVIDEITAAKGVKKIRDYERSPIFGELYKPKSRPGTAET